MPSNLREKLSRYSAEELDRLYHRVFDSDDGQIVLEDLRERGFAYGTTYGPDTLFNEGQRAVSLYIESRLNPVEGQPDSGVPL